jgi:hypothetical protein
MSAITITNAGLNLLRDGMSGANNPLITYVALGTSNTSPTVNDTKLGAETFRKAVTSYANGVSTGELLVNMYLSPSDDIGDAIAEVGFFAGNSASSLANSGVLVARGLYSHTKLSTESITFQLDVVI